MAKFQFMPTVGIEGFTARLGAGTGTTNNLGDTERGKPVKLVGDSRYDLCAAGDLIEAFIVSVEAATADGYTIGTLLDEDFVNVVANGLQGTEGTGNLSIGDFVVAGTNPVKGTKLANETPIVVKATSQAISLFPWRVVSLGKAGTGAPGTTVVVDRVNS